MNQRRKRLILSGRAAHRGRRKELLDQLTWGEERTGVVRNLVDHGAFVHSGAFVDIGCGVEGLEHTSEMLYGQKAGVEPGREVPVMVCVVSIHAARRRLGRSRCGVLDAAQVEQLEEAIDERAI